MDLHMAYLFYPELVHKSNLLGVRGTQFVLVSGNTVCIPNQSGLSESHGALACLQGTLAMEVLTETKSQGRVN